LKAETSQAGGVLTVIEVDQATFADARPAEVAKGAAEDASWIAPALIVGEATTLLKQRPGGL
jgi:hypothetical protein